MRFRDELEKNNDKRISAYLFGGWITDIDKDILIEFLIKYFNADTKYEIAEIGVFQGGTSLIFLDILKNCSFHAVDNFLGGPPDPDCKDIKEGFIKYMTRYNKMSQVEIHHGDSIEIGKNWNVMLDIAFVDGNHDEPYQSSDIINFSKWVKIGGYLLVDDYEMAVTRKAVDTLLTNNSSWERINMSNEPEKLVIFKRLN